MTILCGSIGTPANANVSEAGAANLVELTLTGNYTPVFQSGLPLGPTQFKWRTSYTLKDYPITFASGTTLIMDQAEADAIVAAGGASGYTPYVAP